MIKNAVGYATYVTFSARDSGSLVASYEDAAGKLQRVLLPSDEAMLKQMLRKIRQRMVVLGYRFHDRSLLRYASAAQRRGLTHVLDDLVFCCEVCGDPVQVYHTEASGRERRYCKECHSEIVLGVVLGDPFAHPGFNVGNNAIISHERAFHGTRVADADCY